MTLVLTDLAGEKMLKLADKISNLRSLAASPPSDWPAERRLDYIRWACEVAAGKAMTKRAYRDEAVAWRAELEKFGQTTVHDALVSGAYPEPKRQFAYRWFRAMEVEKELRDRERSRLRRPCSGVVLLYVSQARRNQYAQIDYFLCGFWNFSRARACLEHYRTSRNKKRSRPQEVCIQKGRLLRAL